MPVTGRFAPEAADRRSNNTMSAFHPEADPVRQIRHVSKVPTTEVAASFDHFVGAKQHRRRYIDAEHLGNLQVDYRLELRWLLNRDVGRISTLQYLVDENSASAKH